ncbi:MAG: hypothetical protein EOR48_28715 [Mesorhizobium sp.]|nr:MAG: hypothetical protein EOR48_28715 [Mesorhizobium sp.]TIP42286.1 MAG: hypothetical protein E5X62_22415 [Mesorhizobium sp.]
MVALAENHADMNAGDYGLLCAFGAGYSIGGRCCACSDRPWRERPGTMGAPV